MGGSAMSDSVNLGSNPPGDDSGVCLADVELVRCVDLLRDKALRLKEAMGGLDVAGMSDEWARRVLALCNAAKQTWEAAEPVIRARARRPAAAALRHVRTQEEIQALREHVEKIVSMPAHGIMNREKLIGCLLTRGLLMWLTGESDSVATLIECIRLEYDQERKRANDREDFERRRKF
jgi:hypothetical protein